jgi:DNA-binding transcriptional ArsR family regulator
MMSDLVLDALGDSTRRSIVNVLGPGPLAVGEVAARLPVSRPAVSQHLRVLERAGLVCVTPDGRRRLYALDRRGFRAAREWLDGFWTQGLADFAALAEATWDERHGAPR